MEWLEPYLFPMEYLIFFSLSSVWLNAYYMSFFKKMVEIKDPKSRTEDSIEKDEILQFFEILFSTFVILGFAQMIASYYEQYPNLLTVYTIFCVVFLLSIDFTSTDSDDEKKDEKL